MFARNSADLGVRREQSRRPVQPHQTKGRRCRGKNSVVAGKGVPATLSEPVNDFTKKENLEVKGKFQVLRAADNTILIAVGQKYETVFLTKSTKITRGDKTIQPADLEQGDDLQAKVTKTQGKMTATEIVVADK
ncbi:MAG: hypothetical protein EXS18_05385 [Verrucomicrobiae bacterium]|nr:hypothetical protein [Verrucomicrobiae bacterium]